jgi:hypothetical protein
MRCSKNAFRNQASHYQILQLSYWQICFLCQRSQASRSFLNNSRNILWHAAPYTQPKRLPSKTIAAHNSQIRFIWRKWNGVTNKTYESEVSTVVFIGGKMMKITGTGIWNAFQIKKLMYLHLKYVYLYLLTDIIPHYNRQIWIIYLRSLTLSI